MTERRKEQWWFFKHKVIQLMGGLVMEKGDTGRYVISMGRVAFWLLLLPALWIWMGRGQFRDAEAMRDISPNHTTILLWLLAYNLGKRGLNIASTVFNKSGGNDSGSSITETNNGDVK